ncbi:MAG: hypothetical protein MI743_01310 [Sneathiellales bacterium]|nr:hypothetical protein [Sneathiellales bacterium]
MKKPKPVSRGSPYATGSSVAITTLLALTLFALSKPDKVMEKLNKPDAELQVKPASVILANTAISLPKPPPVQMPEPELEAKSPANIKTENNNRAKKSEAQAKPAASMTEKKGPLPREVLKKKQDPVLTKNAVLEPEELIEKGRTSLKLLEHGKEDMINLVWPENPEEMETLYKILKSRLGMQTVLIDQSFRIYSMDEQPGQGTSIDRDRFSTIIRSPEGQLPNTEAMAKQRLFARHRKAKEVLTLVRIFPRNSDALLLGAIERLRQSRETADRLQNIWISFKNGRLRLWDNRNNEIHISL